MAINWKVAKVRGKSRGSSKCIHDLWIQIEDYAHFANDSAYRAEIRICIDFIHSNAFTKRMHQASIFDNSKFINTKIRLPFMLVANCQYTSLSLSSHPFSMNFENEKRKIDPTNNENEYRVKKVKFVTVKLKCGSDSFFDICMLFSFHTVENNQHIFNLRFQTFNQPGETSMQTFW